MTNKLYRKSKLIIYNFVLIIRFIINHNNCSSIYTSIPIIIYYYKPICGNYYYKPLPVPKPRPITRPIKHITSITNHRPPFASTRLTPHRDTSNAWVLSALPVWYQGARALLECPLRLPSARNSSRPYSVAQTWADTGATARAARVCPFEIWNWCVQT